MLIRTDKKGKFLPQSEVNGERSSQTRVHEMEHIEGSRSGGGLVLP